MKAVLCGKNKHPPPQLQQWSLVGLHSTVSEHSHSLIQDSLLPLPPTPPTPPLLKQGQPWHVRRATSWCLVAWACAVQNYLHRLCTVFCTCMVFGPKVGGGGFYLLRGRAKNEWCLTMKEFQHSNNLIYFLMVPSNSKRWSCFDECHHHKDSWCLANQTGWFVVVVEDRLW